MAWINIIWEIFINSFEGFLFLYLLIHQLEYDAKKRPYIIGGIVSKIILLSFFKFVSLDTIT